MCIRDSVRGDVQRHHPVAIGDRAHARRRVVAVAAARDFVDCLLYTSDAADERSSVDLGGRRIIKKKNNDNKYVGLRGARRRSRYLHY